MIDCHTHTNNSPDAENSPLDMVKQGISLGLDVMAITDHCEVNMWYPKKHYKQTFDYDGYDYMSSLKKSLADSTKLKHEFKDKITILSGVELGQASMDFNLAEKILLEHEFDFVIGSVHQIYGFPDFFIIDYDNVNVDTLLRAYFLNVLKLCKWGRFDILGHLTYPIRYLSEKGITVDMSKFNPIIEEIFKTIIGNGVGIEVNSSGLRQKCGIPFPSVEYVQMYKDFGGTIVSVGSDAHSVEQLGKNVQECIDMVKSCGFEYLTYFKDREPIRYYI